jgi:L-malate glycosyltransferase
VLFRHPEAIDMRNKKRPGEDRSRLVVITDDWKGAGGGIETQMVNLVETLKKMGVETTVLYKNGNDPDSIHIEGDGLRFSLRALLALRKIGPSVINSQGPWACLLAGSLYKRFHKVRLVHSFNTQPVRRLGRNGRLVLQWLIDSCDAVTFASSYLERTFRETYGLRVKRSEVIYGGVRPAEVCESDMQSFRQEYNLGPEAIVILGQALTANELKAEGAKILIRSVHKLRAKYPNLVLILTRDGSYSEELKKVVRDEGVINVIFTGDVANPFIPLTICDLLAHITLVEGGVSRSIMEAMSIGKPILASSVGGIPEIIRNNQTGLLVEPNEESVSQGIEYMLDRRDLSTRLGQNARSFVEFNITWERTAQQFVLIYNGGERRPGEAPPIHSLLEGSSP